MNNACFNIIKCNWNSQLSKSAVWFWNMLKYLTKEKSFSTWKFSIKELFNITLCQIMCDWSKILFMNESYRFRNLWTCNTVYIWLRRSSSLSRLVVKKLWNHTKAAGSPLNFKGKHSRMQDVYRCKALVKMPQKFNKETRFEYENHSWRKGATGEKENLGRYVIANFRLAFKITRNLLICWKPTKIM